MVDIKDKAGDLFRVLPWTEKKPDGLRVFYDRFVPKGEYQGIPPPEKRARSRWIKALMIGWENFVILEGDRIVGHVAVSMGQGAVQELIIFLHQDYRGRGIGSQALGTISIWLKEKGFRMLWLTVQNINLSAIRCFRKVGFQFTSPLHEPEREMMLDLEKSV